MKIAIVRERADGETRVAATPESVKKLVSLGADVSIEAGAGAESRIPDQHYTDMGAKVESRAESVLKDADVVLTVRRPDPALLKGVKKGALVLGALDPFGHEGEIAALGETGVSTFAMEFMPRITRAQSMDILSSQANLAGYQAVIDAAEAFDRALPMMMTAAGTVRAAKVFVMGAGVAGLQAIATAKRLGAAVSATDVRAAAGEQVASLGAKFIMTEALKDASGEGGYARELTKEEQAAQAELVADHIAKQDIVITTALIPGRPAPKLVTKAMVESMAPGSIVVDLATERGGNVELSKAGETVVHKDVTILGHLNMPGKIAATASQLYSKNLINFLETMIDTEAKAIKVDWEDDLVKATLLTRDGAVVNERIIEAAKAAPKPAGGAQAASASTRKSASASKAASAGKTATKKAPAKSGSASKTASKSSSASASKTGATRKTPTKSGASKSTTARKSTPAKTGASGKDTATDTAASSDSAANKSEGDS